MLVKARTAIEGLSGSEGKLGATCADDSTGFPDVEAASNLTTNASTGRAMFFRFECPKLLECQSSRSCT